MAEASDNRLRLLVERYERLAEERDGISQDMRDVVAEAKAVGYDARAFRQLIVRRAMKPDDRAEADAILQVYEAALGMDGEAAEAALRAVHPDAMAIATLMLAEQVEGLSDPAFAAALVGHVLALIDLRAEIALLRTEESQRKRLAAGEGFDAKQLAQVVRWVEKVAKHGLEAMQLGEATFRQYRSTFDARPDRLGPVTDDQKLAGLFQPKAAPVKAGARAKRISEAEIWAGFGKGE